MHGHLMKTRSENSLTPGLFKTIASSTLCENSRTCGGVQNHYISCSYSTVPGVYGKETKSEVEEQSLFTNSHKSLGVVLVNTSVHGQNT